MRGPLLAIAQLFTIPGMAALFSLILYGWYQWKRRVTFRFIAVAGFVLLLVLIVSPLGLLANILEARGIDPGSSTLFSTAAMLCTIAILVAVPILLFFINRKAGKRSVELESSRWLAERKAGIGAVERKWRERAIRWSLWIPSLTVLAVFSFLPETWGFMSHLQQPSAVRLLGYETRVPGYEIRVPLSWTISFQGSNSMTGASWVFGWAARGPGFGIRRYLHPGDLPFSSWSVEIAESDKQSAEFGRSSGNGGASRHDFQIGKGRLTCFESQTPRARWLHSSAEPLAFVECSGPDRLRASFMGEKTHLATFYAMLESITPALPLEIK